MKRLTIGILLATLLILTAALAGPAVAKRSTTYPRVLPPTSSPYGATYAEWGARWWQWCFSLPMSENPMFDATGEHAAAGQSGPVWYLAGTFTGGDPDVARSVTIPQGKALLIPIINVEGSLEDTPQASTFAEVVQMCEDFTDTISIADLTVDGRLMHIGPDTPYRTGLVISWYSLPVDNVLGLAPGTYSPVAYDGYYAMLAPLSVGHHTVEIHGRGVWLGSTFDTHALYDIAIKR